MNNDFFIYPATKTAVGIVSSLLAACAVICALCIPLSIGLLLLIFFFPATAHASGLLLIGNIPFSETVCIFQYIASICLLLLSPWCVQVLLAGSGSPPIRFFSRACLLLIPIGPFLSGFKKPVVELFSYYLHLIGGNPAYEDGFYLMQAFDYIGGFQCFFAVIIAAVSFRYTSGYPASQRRLLLCWIICWGLDVAIKTIKDCLLYMEITLDSASSLSLIIISTVLQTAFWMITAWFAFQLAGKARLIAGMPELNKYLFPGKK